MEQKSIQNNEQREENNTRRYKIRQVTEMQPSWVEGERGGDGKFFIQLILDSGVDEYIIQPSAEDADVIIGLFKKSKHTIWDDERKILIFDNISLT